MPNHQRGVDHDNSSEFFAYTCRPKKKLWLSVCLYGIPRTASPIIQSYIARMVEPLVLFSQRVRHQTQAFDGSTKTA